MRQKIKYMLPAIMVMILIFCFSAQPAWESTKNSNYVVDQVVAMLRSIKGVSDHTSMEVVTGVEEGVLTFITRKLAHTFEYMLLGIALCFSFVPYALPKGKRYLFVISIGFFYACSDELHQYFVPGRSPEFRDVLIDTNGVFLGILLVLIFGVIRKTKRFSRRR